MLKIKKISKLRIIFMGTSRLAEVVLESLLNENYNIVAVFTRPDKKAGRKKELKTGPVKNLANQYNLPLFQPEKFDKDTISEIIKIQPDLIVVAAYGKILPPEILQIPGFGSLNVHTSLLPKFRGPSPIQNSLLNNEKETGVTIILMDEGIDTGDIISQEKIEIGPQDNFENLYPELSKLGAKLLLKTIPLWIEGKLKRKKQDNSRATLCQLIERSDGQIFWNETAENIYNKYRAFYPWPGIFSFWEKNDSLRRIKFCKISLQKENYPEKYCNGEVFQLKDKVGIQAVGGIIIADIIQLEGKKPLTAEEFIIGYPEFIRSILR